MKQRYLYLFIDRLTADYAFELGSTVLLKNNIKHEQDQKENKRLQASKIQTRTNYFNETLKFLQTENVEYIRIFK